MKLIINAYNSFKYKELYEITEWKEACIYKTESIGFIKSTDYTHPKVDNKKYVLGSISTSLTGGMFTTLDPYLEEYETKPEEVNKNDL